MKISREYIFFDELNYSFAIDVKDMLLATVKSNINKMFDNTKINIGYDENVVVLGDLYGAVLRDGKFHIEKYGYYNTFKEDVVGAPEFAEFVSEQFGDGKDASDAFDEVVREETEKVLAKIIEYICEALESVIGEVDEVNELFEF